MATITIFIKESPLQLLAGIPASIVLETNVPSTIFYTLDGTNPSIESSIAIEPIEMPTDSANVVLKTFATDGIDTSPLITQKYVTNIVPGRQPHDKVITNQDGTGKATYPYGSSVSSFNDPNIYLNTGGVIVDDQTQPRVPTGFDGDGYQVGFVNTPTDQYDVLFSETNSIGETGNGIGTLPGKVLSVRPRNDNDHPESTDASKPYFDPKAMVIFQDSRDTPYDPDIPKINRPYFDLEDQAKARDGALLTNIDSVSPQGGFVKAHFNPTDNSLTYYYYDNRVSRWIISKEPYSPSQNPTANMSGIVSRSSRGEGVGSIFKWIPFKYRRLI